MSEFFSVMEVDSAVVGPLVNYLIWIGFMTFIAIVKASRETNSLSRSESTTTLDTRKSELSLAFNDESSKQTINELKIKVDKGQEIIEVFEEQLKKIEQFIETGNSDDFIDEDEPTSNTQ